VAAGVCEAILAKSVDREYYYFGRYARAIDDRDASVDDWLRFYH
jgi:hypothetical protein